MAHRLADARRSLVRAQESARKRLEDIERERREIRASLKSLDAALKALGTFGERSASNRPSDSDTNRRGAEARTDAL